MCSSDLGASFLGGPLQLSGGTQRDGAILIRMAGSATADVCPVRVNASFNVGGVVPPTISVPTRSQFGSRPALRTHACKSGAKGVPGATIGRTDDNQ